MCAQITNLLVCEHKHVHCHIFILTGLNVFTETHLEVEKGASAVKLQNCHEDEINSCIYNAQSDAEQHTVSAQQCSFGISVNYGMCKH